MIALQVEQAVAHETLVGQAGGHEVFSDGGACRKAPGDAVFGDAGKAEFAAFEHALGREARAIEIDDAIGNRAQAGDGFQQFGLSIALDADEADDFAGMHFEVQVVAATVDAVSAFELEVP